MKHSTFSHKLARLVRSHGHPCRVLPDGRIKIASLGVGPAVGQSCWTVSIIPATRYAVTNYLGY